MNADNIKRCIAIVESMAHLQGKERDLLPIVDAARDELDNFFFEYLEAMELAQEGGQ